MRRMREALSGRIDSETKRRLDLEAENWQRAEIETGVAELESGKGVGHEKVAKWLRSWGKVRESKPPR